jgi:hypothetical protein
METPVLIGIASTHLRKRPTDHERGSCGKEIESLLVGRRGLSSCEDCSCFVSQDVKALKLLRKLILTQADYEAGGGLAQACSNNHLQRNGLQTAYLVPRVLFRVKLTLGCGYENVLENRCQN